MVAVSGVATIEVTEAAASIKNAQQFRPEYWHPEYSTQALLCSITVPHIIESMAIVLSRPEPMVKQSWTTFQLLEFVCGNRSKYSNRAVIVIYSNRAFSVNYSQCSYIAWSKSFTLLIVFKLLFKSVPMNQLHGIALSPLIMCIMKIASTCHFKAYIFQKFS